LQKLLSLNEKDLKILHKLSAYHLSVQGTERQKVLPAVQVFSNSIVSAIKWCNLKGLLPDFNSEEAAYVIKLCNDWFDIFNAKGKHDDKNAYGVDIEKQNSILNNMTTFITELRLGRHKSLLLFQKGIIVSNTSLQEMLPYLQEKYSTSNLKVSYIITYRINQDVLEHYFSFIRSIGGAYDHPTPLNFTHRLKLYILGKHSTNALSNKSNVKDSGVSESVFVSLLGNEDSVLTNMLMPYTEVKIQDSYEEEELLFGEDTILTLHCTRTPTCEEEQLLLELDKLEISDIIEEEGLKYVTGYVAYRFKNKYNTLGVETRQLEILDNVDWLQFISRGKYMYPSEELLQAAHIMNVEFNKYYGSSLSKDQFIFQTLGNIVQNKLKSEIPKEVLLCLIRTRTYIRLNEINKSIRNANYKNKPKKCQNLPIKNVFHILFAFSISSYFFLYPPL